MPETPTTPTASRTKAGIFATTHWSVVLAAGDSHSPRIREAQEQLCRVYWYPLYAYVRRFGHGPEDAQDLTQEFFARLLGKKYLGAADPAKGRFRAFLLTTFKRFLANEWDRANRQKRGGGQQLFSLDEADAEHRYLAESADPMTPEKTFERRWALTLLEEVLKRLEQEYAATGKKRVFDELQVLLTGEKAQSPYAEIAARLRMSEGTLKVTVHRLRRRYRELLRLEVAHTVASPNEIEAEIRHLFGAISG